MTLSIVQKCSIKFLEFFPRTKPIVAAVLLGLLGAACSTIDRVSEVFSDPLVLQCPKYRVLADAASLIRFRDGPGRDLIDVNFEGEIVDVELGCTSNISKKTRVGSMDIDVTLVFNASRGPANKDRKARFDYFIRVLDKNENILRGINLSIAVDFPGNKTRLQFRSQPLTLELPITPEWSSSYYRIYAGIKLNREDLKFNRARRANTRK